MQVIDNLIERLARRVAEHVTERVARELNIAADRITGDVNRLKADILSDLMNLVAELKAASGVEQMQEIVTRIQAQLDRLERVLGRLPGF